MSLDASRWAWKQRAGKSAAKLVLLALADAANHLHECFPSISRISADTELNRKTIIAALQELVTAGLIEDTGERRGRTGQIKVLRLVGVEDRHKGIRNEAVLAVCKDGETGIVEASQKRNGTESGTVPFFPSKSTVFSAKESRKRYTEPTKEPTKEPIKLQPAVSRHGVLITLSWTPRSETVSALIAPNTGNVPTQFVQEQIPQFVAYWFDKAEPCESWDGLFRKQILDRWKKTGHTWRAAPKPTETSSAFDRLQDTSWASRLTLEDPVTEGDQFWIANNDQSGESHEQPVDH